ncbi:MAG: PAS domain S-box protein, partial [Chitinophagales bacterium]
MQKDNRKYNFLVVEDNEGDFFLVQDYLEDVIDAPKVIHASKFEDARQILEAGKTDFDAILLDLTLPDKEGDTLVKEMLEISGNTPIIILTGYSDVDFAIQSLGMGIADYLLKDELNAAILYKSIIYNIERKKNLVKLKESEQKYADLFHLSPQPMWVYDMDTLQFLDVNDAAVKHYGYSVEEFREMTIKDIHPEEDIPQLEEVLKKQDKSAKFFKNQFRHKKKFGEIIDVDIQSNVINYNNKKAKIVLANDITERIQHINAITHQNSRLREIAWIQSHVVRAPLARIIGMANMIKSDVLDLSKGEKIEFLDHILSSSEELDDIIKDVI